MGSQRLAGPVSQPRRLELASGPLDGTSLLVDREAKGRRAVLQSHRFATRPVHLGGILPEQSTEVTMSEQDNVQVVRDLYAAFGRGDIPAILDALSDDAQLHHAGLPDSVPWGSRTHAGRDQWAEFFGDLDATLEAELFEPHEYFAQADRVVALGHYRFRAKATGKTFESPWAMAWTIRDGKVADCRVFEDTETQADAIRG
jgi:uncharacterized protein